MGCTLFWVKFGHAFAYFCGFVFTSQMAILSNLNFYFDCKTRLCLRVPGRQEKIFFAQESFYLQGILDDINEQDTSFLDCKHKHMMKSGAPPDKFGVLYRMVTYRISCLQTELILMVITLWFLVLSQFFRDGMSPFKFLSGTENKLRLRES